MPPSPPRSAPPRRKVRMALHAKARKLARHGRIRARRSDQAVLAPPHPGQADPQERSRLLGASPKQAPRQSRLAIHDSQRPRQTQKAVAPVRMTRATRLGWPRASHRQVVLVNELILEWGLSGQRWGSVGMKSLDRLQTPGLALLSLGFRPADRFPVGRRPFTPCASLV